MIFQHTLEAVLDGTKTQTSRVWKDNYQCLDNGSGNNITVLSEKTKRPLYYVGQRHAIQPARGKKGVGYIEITDLYRFMVHNFDTDDIRREGFANMAEFLSLWREMHQNNYLALVIRFKLVG